MKPYWMEYHFSAHAIEAGMATRRVDIREGYLSDDAYAALIEVAKDEFKKATVDQTRLHRPANVSDGIRSMHQAEYVAAHLTNGMVIVVKDRKRQTPYLMWAVKLPFEQDPEWICRCGAELVAGINSRVCSGCQLHEDQCKCPLKRLPSLPFSSDVVAAVKQDIKDWRKKHVVVKEDDEDDGLSDSDFDDPRDEYIEKRILFSEAQKLKFGTPEAQEGLIKQIHDSIFSASPNMKGPIKLKNGPYQWKIGSTANWMASFDENGLVLANKNNSDELTVLREFVMRFWTGYENIGS